MRQTRLYRRSPTLFVHWRDGQIVVLDIALRTERLVSAKDVQLLAALTHWTSADDASRLLGWRRAETAAALEQFAAAGLVERADRPVERRRAAMAAWAAWSPEAAVFHFGTKDVPRIELETVRAELTGRLLVEPPPSPLKNGRRPAEVPLPPFSRRGPLASTLFARRSWRKFGRGAIKRADVSTLLGLTWAVQRWVRVNSRLRVALKTSPSAGACHPIEVYVVAQHVRGLRAGIYHYEPDAHVLTIVRPRLARTTVRRMLNNQPWFADCAALFVMTAVFPRVQWKYPSARAYRTVLLDAGHLGQTFCLVATSLGLAPFCSASLADSRTERMLGIDGVHESVVYAAGVGRRPVGVRWAPWPDDLEKPPTIPPAHAAGLARRR